MAYDYTFKWVHHRYKAKQKLDDKVHEYNTQYCFNCHHTMTLDITQDKAECSWCHTWNRNRTKGRYHYMMNKLIKKDYKTIKLEGEKNGKERI